MSDINDAKLAAAIKSNLMSPAAGASMLTLQLANGTARVFVERIEPPTPLVIFGAGHDAMPVARLAKEIGWHITIVDHRAAYANIARFPQVDRIVICNPQDVVKNVNLDGDTLALVMTHNYLRDRDLLDILLRSEVRYLGMLGPRKRTDQLLADLRERGMQPGTAQLGRLYAPVGLDIGSEGPAEVAMSILSEMQAVITSHRGGHLRERKRPIHQTEHSPVVTSSLREMDSSLPPLAA